MPATKTREDVYEKAARLVAQGRFQMMVPSNPPDFWVGTCLGDRGVTYACFAVSAEYAQARGLTGGRVGCTCDAGRRLVLCKHALGAEELRLRGEVA